MFDGNVSAQGFRRLHRSTVPFARNLEAAGGLREREGLLGALRQWATGMPWVVESSAGARERVNLFMLDCPPLCRHEPWFAISRLDDDTDESPGIVVILSDTV